MNELIFGERHYRRVGERFVSQQDFKPGLIGIWEMKWRHVGFREVANHHICVLLDKGVDPWLHGYAPPKGGSR